MIIQLDLNTPEEKVKELIDKGVIVAQCSNSLQERSLKKDQLYD